jgi:hypothetical protein
MSFYASYFPSGAAGIPLNSFDALVSEDGGRVFFNSDDGLVPKDVNGQEDVYEWEREGIGS